MDKQFEQAVYEACLKSAIAMGDKIYDLSWFGKNHRKASAEQKLAA